MGAAFKRLKSDNGKYSKLQQFVKILPARPGAFCKRLKLDKRKIANISNL